MKSAIVFSLLVASVRAERGSGAGPPGRLEEFEAANQKPNATGRDGVWGLDMSLPAGSIFAKPW